MRTLELLCHYAFEEVDQRGKDHSDYYNPPPNQLGQRQDESCLCQQ